MDGSMYEYLTEGDIASLGWGTAHSVCEVVPLSEAPNSVKFYLGGGETINAADDAEKLDIKAKGLAKLEQKAKSNGRRAVVFKG